MSHRSALTRRFPRAIVVIFALAFAIGCSEDETPPVFGNDGATLNNLSMNGALALLANAEGKRVEDPKGEMTFPAMKLYTLSKGGVLAELPLSFSGKPNGGTDHYVLYDMNERYSILSFYTRAETYIIDQANGEVHKSIYMEWPQHCVAGVNELYFDDNYAYNVEGRPRYVKISNFLSEKAEETEVPNDVGSFILDEDANLYAYGYGSSFFVAYQNNGVRTKIASDAVGIFKDHEDKLSMVSLDGAISTIRNGSVQAKASLKDVSLTNTLFHAYPFPRQHKTLVVARDNVSYFTMLYDITSGEKKLNISTLEQGNFDFIAGSAFDKYLFLLGSVADGTLLVRIDITDYSYTKVVIDSPDLVYAESLTALSDTELIASGCDPLPGTSGGCQARVRYFDMTGKIKTVFDKLDGWLMVRLSDNQ